MRNLSPAAVSVTRCERGGVLQRRTLQVGRRRRFGSRVAKRYGRQEVGVQGKAVVV